MSDEERKRGRPVKNPEDKKKSTSFTLSPQTKTDLAALSKDMRISRASVIETLVAREAKRLKRGA